MTLCHCGQPLHYQNPEIERIMHELVATKGEFIKVTHAGTGRSYLVPRHFIALHKLEADKLPEYGFQEFIKE